MEFLKGLKEARDKGLSKDEYVYEWETKMNELRHNIETKIVGLQSTMQPELNPMKNSSNNMINQNKNYLEQTVACLQQEFHQQLEEMKKSVKEMCEEQHRVLRKFVEDECVMNLNSMKQYVQNEMQLMFESIEKKLNCSKAEDPFSYHTDNLNGDLFNKHQGIEAAFSSANFFQPSAHNYPQHIPFDYPQQILLDYPQQKISDYIQHIPSDISQKIPSNTQQLPLDNAKPSLSTHSQQPATQSFLPHNFSSEKAWDNSRMSYAAVAAAIPLDDDYEQILLPGVEEDSGSVGVSSEGTESSDPVHATGPIAEIISQQLSQTGLTSSGSQSSVSRSRPASALASRKPSETQIGGVQTNEIRCVIPNCSELAKNRKIFYSKYVYTQPKRCKVRLGVHFTETSVLSVNVLVCADAIHDELSWPITFSGRGEIYNHGSKRFTQIWELKPQACLKPKPGSEVRLRAHVALVTSRATYTEVSFEQLCTKRYENENKLSMKFSIKASDDPQ
ncbi:uncharacterized protein LOC131938561 [Physella acuta]|uniref:uncharacterized protein LOC131938561 n=1 Tax=Physella acuta TaxID=109671 RepID=UPI0027DB55D6|nr:uncharacterized protein LOC131938561 [Physella acuta]XP_059152621.1 uncharacterized protein LOC131938561 [Physella acuta]XP_059152622.1 uncharacterized protein LOC131938561 [Physella acuta]XP_059152623.1 uncharacterized protein LOC131938561 [Physella acuta]XP_059152624.1 uncharacterized protein LOC131938561 [Physella acuta]XP_059152625.1 uncharacterized protein LOC131938561 [Physella acuta]XP_059152626.1 uncharacterized protein LOC131938561 [Physella acuta]XP_059152627.1 uncharacterized p